jgi:hypothetical protein
VVAILCVNLGGGCSGEQLVVPQQRLGDEEVPELDVLVARAFPAGDMSVLSPFPATIDRCQRSFQIAFEPPDDDFDAAYRDRPGPRLLLSDGGQEVSVESGTWLRSSVAFPLGDNVLDALHPGLWSADVLVGDEVVATVPQVVKIARGDANRDGAVDSGDLVQTLQHGKYETGQPALHDEGDFDCDGDFDSGDLVAMLQGDEGVLYEGGAYVDSELAEKDDDERWIVTDYECWLAAYALPQEPMTTAPAADDPRRNLLTYSDMQVERSCSAPAWDPEFEAEQDVVDMTFADPSVASYLHARCGFDGMLEAEADDELSPVGESWTAGSATLRTEGNVTRDVWLVCEPLFESVYIQDPYGVPRFAGDNPRMDEGDACALELGAETTGRARAHAVGGHADKTLPSLVTGSQDVEAFAKSRLLLRHPDLGHVSSDENSTPPGFEIVGTATAEAPGEEEAIDADTQKCVVELLSFGWLPDPKTVVRCFWNIVVSDAVEGSLGGSNPTATATGPDEAIAVVHLGWAKREAGEEEPDYARPLTAEGSLKLFPVVDGPFRKNLGKIRVHVEQEVTSHAVASHVEYDVWDIVTSEAVVNQTEASVRLSVYAPYPDPPAESDDWSAEEWSAWEEEHWQHCRVPTGVRSLDGDAPQGVEPTQNADVVMERGSAVSVSTADFDRRYWIGRDGTIESLLDRFGAW